MTRTTAFALRPVDDRAAVVCLSGALDSHTAVDFAGELDEQLAAAASASRRLILDMTALSLISEAALRAIDTHTRHLDEPVLIVAHAPQVREAFSLDPPPGLRWYPTLDAALAALAHGAPVHPAPEAREQAPALQELQSEVFGLHARARSRGTIGMAQGMLRERYHLEGADQAFTLLRLASQHHNVPLRVLASAIVTAPPPASEDCWFPGRLHTPPPTQDLLNLQEIDVHNRLDVLRAVTYQAIALTEADAAELHLTDPALADALILEGHAALNAPYRDSISHVSEPPALCAQARDAKQAVFVADITTDPVLAHTPQGRAALTLGSHALHAQPSLSEDTGACTGVITVHRDTPGARLSPIQHTALEVLAADLAAWRSWYRRTVVLDALEGLHTHGLTPHVQPCRRR
ncbi:ANTAR domain-containing protein [Streptomyces sp. NPDC048419]|uniref:ANTAR domain-containing protein n=1 Tax=Streptomyces sp. NPDC048419 TaxID=3365547 RepID=UPI0037203F42